MATIIRLERIEESLQNRDIGDGEHRRETGEVVLFPGVRYERWPEAGGQADGTVPVDGARARARAERDWLNI